MQQRVDVLKIQRNVFWPMEQSAPVQLASQTQVPESVLKVPWLEHCSGQVLFRISQLIPPQPGLQWHSPWWQAPWPEHFGSTQSTEDTHSKGDSDVSLPLPDRISNPLIYPGHFDSATGQNHLFFVFFFFLRVSGSAPVPDDGWWATAEHFAAFSGGW